jgi:hypothetical protein
VTYAVENAIFQWEEGERRVRAAADPQQQRAVELVIEELRRRLGSTFSVSELANFYAEGTDWAADIAERRFSGTDVSSVVDAAFNRYVREAADYGGGRVRQLPERE